MPFTWRIKISVGILRRLALLTNINISFKYRINCTNAKQMKKIYIQQIRQILFQWRKWNLCIFMSIAFVFKIYINHKIKICTSHSLHYHIIHFNLNFSLFRIQNTKSYIWIWDKYTLKEDCASLSTCTAKS